MDLTHQSAQSRCVKTSPRNTNRLINVSPMALTFAYGSINSQINAQSGEATLDEGVGLALSAGTDARHDCALWVRVRAARNRNFNTQADRADHGGRCGQVPDGSISARACWGILPRAQQRQPCQSQLAESRAPYMKLEIALTYCQRELAPTPRSAAKIVRQPSNSMLRM